jgi:CRP/FNR family transcriptional regulator, cyclic AMP receptor protein
MQLKRYNGPPHPPGGSGAAFSGPSDAVFYIQKGKVSLTVVSKTGKEATIGILQEGDFFGEGCLAGQRLRLCSATAMTDCAVMRIEKKSMVKTLHEEHELSDLFVAHLAVEKLFAGNLNCKIGS